MDLETFINQIAEQLVATPSEMISPSTMFRDLDEWDSITALSIIAMADEKYGVELTGEDLRESNTVLELFERIQSKYRP